MRFFVVLKVSLRVVFIAILSFVGNTTYAQGRIDISGKVISKKSGEPLPNTPILIKELDIFSVTTSEGTFEFKNIPPGEYSFFVRSLGYQVYEKLISITPSFDNFMIKLAPKSLTLEKIEVVATQGGGVTTSSMMNQQAIEHIQPTNINDIMQLLPGNLVHSDQKLNSIKQLSIRSLKQSDYGLGVPLIIDGAIMENDHNMQVLSSTSTPLTTARQGIDIRQFSTDNIESVAVIRGIPSVEYGNMTSGGVIVRTKSGKSPLQLRVKTDPNIKLLSVGQGIDLNQNRGVLNVDLDYTLSNASLTEPTAKYSRVNFNLGHSITPRQAFSLTSKLSLGYGQSKQNNDPDIIREYLLVNRNMRIRGTLNGSWRPSKPWLSRIDFNLSAGVQDQLFHEKKHIAGTQSGTFSPYDTATVAGIHEGLFTKRFYQYWQKVHGKPIDFQSKIIARLIDRYGKINNSAMIGFSFSSKGNRGRGKSFDLQNPPTLSSVSILRERAYADIPFLNNLSIFAEDKITIPIGKKKLDFQGGLRLNTVLPNKSYILENRTKLEPRFNARYVIAESNKALSHLSLRAGWGLTSRTPTMSQLFPEPVYYDRLVFSHTEPTKDNFDLSYGFNLFEVVKRTDNVNTELKMPVTRKAELGIDFSIKGISGEIVYFNEYTKNRFGAIKSLEPYNYNLYGYSSLNTIISYPTGSRFRFDSNSQALYVSTPGAQETQVPMLPDTIWRSYTMHGNQGGDLRKWGIEFTINFGQLKPIRTTIHLNGAYLREEFFNNNLVSATASQLTTSSDRAKYIGFYPGSTTPGNGRIHDRLNTTFRFITHIPRVGFVTTLTSQIIWHEGSQTRDCFNGENHVYYYSGEDFVSEKIYGERIYSVKDKTKYVDPLFLMDKKGNRIPFTDQMSRDPQYRLTALLNTNHPTDFMKETYTPGLLLNLRLSKKVGDFATIAFFANNFLNMRGIRKLKFNGKLYKNFTGKTQNPPPYFGAEIKFNI